MGKKQKQRKARKEDFKKAVLAETNELRKNYRQRVLKRILKKPLPLVASLALIVLAVSLLTYKAGGRDKNSDSSPAPKTSSSDNREVVVNSSAVPEEKKMARNATIKMEKGDIKIELYPEDAPKTVENFSLLAGRGYFNGLTFHRVEPDFVVQGGDPNCQQGNSAPGCGSGGKSAWGGFFKDELNPNTESYKRGYKEGVVAMANSGPNTNGSQFFIMLKDNDALPKNYSIFGRVTSGMDVVKKISVGDKMINVLVE